MDDDRQTIVTPRPKKFCKKLSSACGCLFFSHPPGYKTAVPIECEQTSVPIARVSSDPTATARLVIMSPSLYAHALDATTVQARLRLARDRDDKDTTTNDRQTTTGDGCLDSLPSVHAVHIHGYRYRHTHGIHTTNNPSIPLIFYKDRRTCPITLTSYDNP